MTANPPETSPEAPPGPAPDEPELLARERRLVREIRRLAAERSAAEARVEGARASNDAKADAEYGKARSALADKHDRIEREARADDEKRRRAIVDAALADEAKAKGEFGSSSRRIAAEFESLREAAKNDYQRGRSGAETTFATGTYAVNKSHADEVKPVDELAREADAIRARLDDVAASYPKLGVDATLPAPTPENYAKFPAPVIELQARLERMGPPLTMLEGLVLPKMTRGAGAVWLCILAIVAPVALAAALGVGPVGLGIAAAVGVALWVALRQWLIGVSRNQLRNGLAPLVQSLSNADAMMGHLRAVASSKREEAARAATARRDEELKRAKDAHARAVAEGEAARDEKIRKISEGFAVRTVEIQTAQQRGLRDAIDAHDRLMAEIPARRAAASEKLDEQYRAVKAQIVARHESSWSAMADRWREGMRAAADEFDAIGREVDALNPPPGAADRALPSRVPPVVRLGTATLDLAAVPGGASADPRLMEGVRTAFPFPLLRPFPSRANLWIEAPPEGRAAATAALQAAMFRLLASLPPGQVRFTILDPGGIGRPFGAFMHLADFDGDLVTNQVWTDPRQIDERLADLSAHMETVAQKYLRNEYATIEEYNAVAGEVAEPYRVLVVADFPGKLDERSASRVAAIAAGGVPCGVLTLLVADPSRPLPEDLDAGDLRSHFRALSWDGAAPSWDDPDFGTLPILLDAPPPAEVATATIQKIGAAATAVKRVEVPFEFIAPPADALWAKDGRAGIDVPLGRSGATKRQNLTLGRGTSQHVLIAGRTGSGKSTLMHALIVNTALNYSPDEVELYLIDFKKGVEFKVYATHALPHAAVVAIESEREFGLSVLQRIDAELRERADRFRAAGVQDVNGFRNAPGAPPLPRILLIVDEFQEFFVEEDKLAQEAALLLDRIVRQGRAFGVHVHLGSQSLTGAYALARSTLGQMAVRIALQCSEVDSHLILSEQNPAAKLLSRPGEAIYNDANGAPEGNHFFQVVWLADERREEYLTRIRDLARERPPKISRTPIVFEGDAAADLGRNPLMLELLDAPGWPDAPRPALAWLGEPIAIKEPTSAPFRRQGGNHLLIVGQQPEAAAGVVASALLSLAAQFPPARSDAVRSGARFFLLDGTPEGDPLHGAIAEVAESLPHGVRAGGWRDVPRVLAEFDAELNRRKGAEGEDGPEWFLFLHDLPNFRDLRRKEDDFSFSRKEEKAAPSDQLESVLREGPRLGLHVVAWCDTVSNLNRYFTHQVLREIAMRVFFQMSATDSGHLLDSPEASRLGKNRALLVSEEQNRHEKFRPYAMPSGELNGRVVESFGRRGDGA